MRIKLVSDLHLEFTDYEVKNTGNADVLIMAGDIMVADYLHSHPSPDPYSVDGLRNFSNAMRLSLRFIDFLKRVSTEFPHVIYIAGNHEFYNGRWNQSIDDLRMQCSQLQNVHFLERDMVTINDITFIGGTLWTDMNNCDPLTLYSIRDMLNDYRKIRNDVKGFTSLKPSDTVIRHKETLKYIKHAINDMHDKKVVVVGHHSPSFLSVSEPYKTEIIMNGAYHSDLSNFILDHPQIKLWVHGHTHHAVDYMIGTTRIVCNPRGYHSDTYSENTGFNPDCIIEL